MNLYLSGIFDFLKETKEFLHILWYVCIVKLMIIVIYNDDIKVRYLIILKLIIKLSCVYIVNLISGPHVYVHQ